MIDKLQLLKEIAELLNEETIETRMLNRAIQMLIEHTHFDTAWIFLIDYTGRHQLVAHYNLPKALIENSCEYLTGGTCWCVRKYNNDTLTKATNIIVCSRLESAHNANVVMDITHHATVPLSSGEENFGLLNVATNHKKEYTDGELALMEAVALQIGSAIKRIRLTNEERENALIRERQRLARDLHDSVNQMLFSIQITSHAARAINDVDKTKEALSAIEDVSKHAMKEMKALIWQLKPIGLEQGIVNAIEQHAHYVGIRANVSVEGLYKINDDININVYRIIQEALNNISKHAETDLAFIDIKQLKNHLNIIIYDKGIGFNVNQMKLNTDGIRNMKARVEKLNGEIELQSTIGKGTKIMIQIPLKEAMYD